MKWNKVLQEKKIPIIGRNRAEKKLLQYRGIYGMVLDENEPPDVHGIPKELEAYGRGGIFPNGGIFIDGGPQGSRQGHPNTIKNGFYWGADYEAKWGDKEGVFYLRGRAGTDIKVLVARLEEILDLVFKRLPKR